VNHLLATLLTLLNAIWLLLTVLGLPGNWLMIAGTLAVAWWSWKAQPAAPMFSTAVLVAACGLALTGELLELLAGLLGSRTAGGTRRGATGALLGALAGGILGTFLIPLPILGSLLGTCAGAALGAWGLELSGGRTMRASLRSGLGAGLGRFFGTTAKLAIGLVIWIMLGMAAFWP